jgi:large subunit ribosomal protein L15
MVNVETLAAAGIIRGNKDGVRILAKGKIKASLTCEVDGATRTAIVAIEKVGGKVILPSPTKVEILSQKKSEKTAAKKLAAGLVKKAVISDDENLELAPTVDEDPKLDE